MPAVALDPHDHVVGLELAVLAGHVEARPVGAERRVDDLDDVDVLDLLLADVLRDAAPGDRLGRERRPRGRVGGQPRDGSPEAARQPAGQPGRAGQEVASPHRSG